MRFRLSTSLLLLLSGPLCLAFQTGRPAFQLHEIHPTAESKVVQDQALAARKRLLLANENAEKIVLTATTDNTPDAQAKAAEAQKQVADAQKAAEDADKQAKEVQSAPISQQNWKQMQSVLEGEKNRYESSMKRNSAMATTLVMGGILLALMAALAGFLR